LTRRYRSAARLYAEAFAAQPTLADDLQASHRYDAACSAALAAAGQGKEAPRADDKERARLRQRAAGMRAVRARDAARIEAHREHMGWCCGLLRCVFHPFTPLSPLPPSLLEWQNGLVVTLAQAAYDHHLLPSGELDPARLAVLSDALEDAGCQDAELLGHLRSPEPHVRGCFALDAILGRA
jgi:hypothetical protein